MDQGASADQVLLRDFGQRREDPGLGGHHRLPSRRHCKETPEIATKSPYATSNRGSEPVRENRYQSPGYQGIKARNHARNRQPVESIRFLTGQQKKGIDTRKFPNIRLFM